VRQQAPGQRARLLTIRGNKTLTCGYIGALGGTRTPNLLIRSQMLYPLSYERTTQQYTAVRAPTVRASGAGERAPQHITGWKAYDIGGAERRAGAHACGSRVPTMATSVRRRLRLRT
jgi:hypothetical protein